MTEVDQQTRRRTMRTGVTAYDRDLASPGYVLFNTSGAGDAVYLVNLQGKVVHQWRVPYPPRYGYLLPNGNLFVILKSGGETEPMFQGWPMHQDGLMLELDPHSNVVWQDQTLIGTTDTRFEEKSDKVSSERGREDIEYLLDAA